MKITPSKDYKKPLYAIAVAATIAAVSLTGCGSKDEGPTRRHRDNGRPIKPVETEETEPTVRIEDPVRLDGLLPVETDVFPQPTRTTEPDEELVLAGEATIAEPEDDLYIEGGVAIDEGET